jgi:hypothetical protein
MYSSQISAYAAWHPSGKYFAVALRTNGMPVVLRDSVHMTVVLTRRYWHLLIRDVAERNNILTRRAQGRKLSPAGI